MVCSAPNPGDPEFRFLRTDVRPVPISPVLGRLKRRRKVVAVGSNLRVIGGLPPDRERGT